MVYKPSFLISIEVSVALVGCRSGPDPTYLFDPYLHNLWTLSTNYGLLYIFQKLINN